MKRVPLIWYLAAVQGMRVEQIAARLWLRSRRVLRGVLDLGRGPFSPRKTRKSAKTDRQRIVPAPSQWGPEGGLSIWSLTAFAPFRVFRGLNGPLPRSLGLAGRQGGAAVSGLGAEVREAVVARAEAVAGGRWEFLNEERAWALPVDWNATGAVRLWRFHLHYSDDAPLLALAALVTGDDRFRRTFGDLALDWIAGNPAAAGDGWHPYTLSRRIPNWIYALEILDMRDTPTGARIAASLGEQARFLVSNLEFDALGNHLIANLRALLFAGAFFAGEEAERWWQRAARLLQRQVAEQFLPDGGHCERSPMYHALVLQDLLECALLFRRRGAVPGWLLATLERGVAWLEAMCHPDGGIALFNDCTNEGPPAAELAALTDAIRCDTHGPGARSSNDGPTTCGAAVQRGRSGWRQWVWLGASAPARPEEHGATAEDSHAVPTLTALPESGYFVLRDPAAGHALFFDAGEPCPGHIPAHAHADLLSFELSLGGQRVIVDSGVCEYAAGPWRDYCRSTRAHNTLQVDGQDQSEIWGSFRLGRRARPSAVHWSRGGGCFEVSAAHTGYRRLRGGVLHRRTVRYDGARYHIVDEVTGAGRHRVESFLHFHPRMAVRLEDDTLVAQGQGVALAIHFRGGEATLRQGETAPPQGWYCPEFGLRQPNPVVALTWEGTLPARLCYTIEPCGAIAGETDAHPLHQPQFSARDECARHTDLRELSPVGPDGAPGHGHHGAAELSGGGAPPRLP